MTLANPILLWSLLGLSVPIIIHLLSRKEGQVIQLGSIRHVQETSTQQFKGIRLNELLLLALRCALILVFCLLLSGLRCSGISNEKWVVIETGFEDDPFVKSILDSLGKDGYQKRQLCEGFPAIGCDSVSHLNYWGLVDLLKEKDLSSVVVLSSNRIENFRGSRTSLPSNVRWIAIPISKTDFPLEAIRLERDSVYVRTGHTSADQTFFTSEKMKSPANAVQPSLPDSVRISIFADDQHHYDQRILVASLRAIQKTFPINMRLRELSSAASLTKNCDWLVWLSDSKIPSPVPATVILLQPKSSSNLLESVGQKEWHITKRLNEEVALTEDLTIQLAHLIVPSRRQEEIAHTSDRTVMPDSMAWSSNVQIKEASAASSDASRVLIICLVVLLLLERIISYRRNQ